MRYRIVFVHHHLRPGGVSRVIIDQINSLEGIAEVAVITGEEPQVEIKCPYRILPPIGYDRDRVDSIKPSEISELLIKETRSFWKNPPDIIHVHNPTLGKNKDFLEVLSRLKEKKQNLLLQIHDFSEDGRPGGYSPDPYPADCHYAVINRRDYRILLKSGLNGEGLHYLPNAIHPLPVVSGNKRDLYLYPVRAIRRKNVGEALLLSLFIREGCYVGITLEPTSKLDTLCYRNWIRFSREKGLKVKFALGLKSSFEDVISRALVFITTSIKEGFGFSFLEPWTANRMVSGRLIREVCSDFLEMGINLNSFYRSINVPLDMIDITAFEDKWVNCYKKMLEDFGIEYNEREVYDAIPVLYKDGTIDYGYLSEDIQMEVIENIMKDRKKSEKFLDLNPFLRRNSDFNRGYDNRSFYDMVAHNREVILREYSIDRYRKRLLDTYDRVLNQPVEQSINKKRLLEVFIKPENQYLLLCEESAGFNFR